VTILKVDDEESRSEEREPFNIGDLKSITKHVNNKPATSEKIKDRDFITRENKRRIIPGNIRIHHGA